MIYFDRYKIGKPTKRFYKDGHHFTIDMGIFIATGHNNGIQFGVVVPFTRTWYNCSIKYNRFRKAL